MGLSGSGAPLVCLGFGSHFPQRSFLSCLLGTELNDLQVPQWGYPRADLKEPLKACARITHVCIADMVAYFTFAPPPRRLHFKEGTIVQPTKRLVSTLKIKIKALVLFNVAVFK